MIEIEHFRCPNCGSSKILGQQGIESSFESMFFKGALKKVLCKECGTLYNLEPGKTYEKKPLSFLCPKCGCTEVKKFSEFLKNVECLECNTLYNWKTREPAYSNTLSSNKNTLSGKGCSTILFIMIISAIITMVFL